MGFSDTVELASFEHLLEEEIDKARNARVAVILVGLEEKSGVIVVVVVLVGLGLEEQTRSVNEWA